MSKEKNPTEGEAKPEKLAIRCKYTRQVPTHELQPNPDNPNKHGAKQIALYAKILKHQGWRRPIVVSNRSGLMIRGHGALEAARSLKQTKVPVDFQDYDSKEDEVADMLADNSLPQLADLDRAAVSKLILDLDPSFDATLAGYPEQELEKLLQKANEPSLQLPSGSEEKPPAAPSGLTPEKLPSHVKLVQLYLTTKTQPSFLEQVMNLSKAYGTENLTDTVAEAVRREADRLD